MHTDYTPAAGAYIHALAALLAEEADTYPDDEDEREDLLDWSPEEEAGWAQQDKIDLYRGEI